MTNFLPLPLEVNPLLEELLKGVRVALGGQFVGLALDGSLANGDFDRDSDVDFVVVTKDEISPETFAALDKMHRRISKLALPFATQLEGSYLSRKAIWKHDPALTLHPNLERGENERLKWAEHGEDWAVHRFVLRERGITLEETDFKTLISPVLPDDLKRAMHLNMTEWAIPLLDTPATLASRGYASFVVLSLCRILYTLRYSDVVSKVVAARWAKTVLEARWTKLIDAAWEGRHNPDTPSSPKEISETMDFIRTIVELSALDFSLSLPQSESERA